MAIPGMGMDMDGAILIILIIPIILIIHTMAADTMAVKMAITMANKTIRDVREEVQMLCHITAAKTDLLLPAQ